VGLVFEGLENANANDDAGLRRSAFGEAGDFPIGAVNILRELFVYFVCALTAGGQVGYGLLSDSISFEAFFDDSVTINRNGEYCFVYVSKMERVEIRGW